MNTNGIIELNNYLDKYINTIFLKRKYQKAIHGIKQTLFTNRIYDKYILIRTLLDKYKPSLKTHSIYQYSDEGISIDTDRYRIYICKFNELAFSIEIMNINYQIVYDNTIDSDQEFTSKEIDSMLNLLMDQIIDDILTSYKKRKKKTHLIKRIYIGKRL